MKTQDIIDAIQSSAKLAIGGGQTRGGGNFCLAPSGIVDYSPDELVITLQAGTPYDELEAALQKKGQMLAAEPMDHRQFLGTRGTPTIGGAVGVNADGPRRLRYGALREALLGVDFVDGTGQFIRSGGRVMKNVTGLDVTKFFAGSKGVLGVATEMSFKLLPVPRETVHLNFAMPRDEAMKKLLPLLRQPLEITGAVYANDTLSLRQEGEGLASLKTFVEDALGKGEEGSASLWNELRDWVPMRDEIEVWRIFTRPSLVVQTQNKFKGASMILCGGAQLLVATNAEEVSKNLVSGQWAICEKGVARGQRLPARHLAEEELMVRLKTVYDPEHKFEVTHAH